MSTAFDTALEQRDLYEEAVAYALRHGAPGTAAYRDAWVKFRRRIRTVEDLRRWRRNATAKAERATAPQGSG
jgi:hypothetical protein